MASSITAGNYSYPYPVQAENILNETTVLMLQFFDGQFAEVLSNGLNKSKALGWRGTFMKQGIALLAKRTKGIMEANRRNYYGECAAFIAALGEVKESLGETDAKQKLMTSYKEKYPRRSAFRAEMKFYGWRG